MTDSSDYDSYINSKAWDEKARRIRKRDGYRCQICGANDVPLEVHHLTYDRLYDELDGDLLTVCHLCHEKITESWHSIKDGVKARNAYFSLQRKYEHAEDFAIYLNAMMSYDISFGGRYVLSGYEDIKAACIEEGIEYRHALAIQKVFNRIHVLDVVTKINNGVSRQALIRAGYPKSLIQDIAKRQQQNEYLVSDISDELVCYLHDGEGKWIVTASEDGLETGFIVRFMPYKRYQFKWWDYE
jgi:hypothetical protein